MAQVNTVLGPIDSSELGFTLSHEHITLGAAGAAATYPGFQDRQAIADAAAAALSEAYAGGVRAIIDVTTFDLGRDVAVDAGSQPPLRRPRHPLHRQPSGRAAHFLGRPRGPGGRPVHQGNRGRH